MNEILDVAALRIVDEVFELDGPARMVRVSQACGGDPKLLQRVESLLAALEKNDAFLREPTISELSRSDTRSTVEAPGACIGPYKLVEIIGQGGFGTVFMAEQSAPMRRKVALKIIKLGMDTRQTLARFEAERQTLALMDHPNIARVFDAGATDGGRPYFVMELVHGEPVTSYCDREQCTLTERLVLFRDICLAVQHAHQKGIIHRDLKPTNVLVSVADARPIPKVIDFGIAKATATSLIDKTAVTEFPQLLGTPEYMSPEQSDPASADIDTRSDIYSLGVLLYELLTGTTPFNGVDLIASGFEGMCRILREKDPPRPSLRLQALIASSAHVRIQTPADAAGKPKSSSAVDIARRRRLDLMPLTRALRGDLDWIVLKCLERDRTRRYESAGALADDIARHLSNDPVLATPPSAGYRLRKFARRNRAAVLAGTAVAVTLFIAAGVSVEFGLRETHQRGLAEKANGQAQARADELERVVEFQGAQLSGIDAQTMGARLRADLLRKARAAGERRGLSPEELNVRMGEFERLIAGSDFTGIALDSLNDNFFEPASTAINRQFAEQPLVKARLLETLAVTLYDVGLLEAATRTQEQALEIRRRLLGDSHPDTLRSITNMGRLLCDQHRLSEAEAYCREAIDTRRRVLGHDHPDLVDSLTSFGILLQAQGKLAEAESYHREALDLARRVLGDEKLETLSAIMNMGCLLQSQGKLTEAEPYFQEALEKFRRVLGDENYRTLIAINSMGRLLQLQGKLAQAETYYRQTLEIRRRTLGNEHPHTLNSINNLGTLLNDQGKLAEAEPYYREALDIRRRTLGDEDLATLGSINNMASLLWAQGKFAEAEEYYREALEKRRRALGEENPVTVNSINNLGVVLQTQGKLSEAEPYIREALEKSRRILGEEHHDTIGTINNLGLLLKAQGKLAEAEPYLREALEKYRRALGEEHPNTLIAMINLGMLLEAEGHKARAEPYLREAMEGRRKSLGGDHPETLRLIAKMGELLHAMGRDAEAVALLAPEEPVIRRVSKTDETGLLLRFLTALGRSRLATTDLEAAATDLNEAYGIMISSRGVPDQERMELLQSLVELYDAWHAAEPDKGYDVNAAEWRERLKAFQASTQPAHQSP